MTTQAVSGIAQSSQNTTDPSDSSFIQQVLVAEALSSRMVENSAESSILSRVSPVFQLEKYYSEQFDVLSEIAQETITHLGITYVEISNTPSSSEKFLEFRANIKFLRAVIELEEAIPRSLTAMLPSGQKKELISSELKEKVQYLHGSCTYNLKLFSTLFSQKAIELLSELGWDLEKNKDEVEIVKKWTHKMIVPLSLSEARTISMAYPWKNYIIDNTLSPADTRILDLISRLPANVETPDHFRCPIGLQVMGFPIQTPCGHIYDKHSLVSALRDKKECPLDRTTINGSELHPAKELQNQIHAWLEQQYVKITAYAKLPKNNFLTIRGSNSGLSWSQGIPLKEVEQGIWEVEIPFVQGCKYKILINDNTNCWETGKNHVIGEHVPQKIVPTFPTQISKKTTE